MAIFNAKSRAGSANLGTPLMILSFGAIAGFIYWLSANAEPTQIAVEEPSEVVSGDLVSMAAFSTGPAGFLGTEIQLQNIPVASALGPHAFWTSLQDANDTPYLVRFGADLVAGGASASAGSRVDITGTVVAMSDSILNAWEAGGSFPGSADRIQAEFAEDFLEITSIDEVTPAPSS